MKIRKILYPTDFTDANRPILELAGSLARVYGAELLVAHVHEPALPPSTIAGATVAASQSQIDNDMRQLEQIHPADTTLSYDHRMISGSPPEAIITLASDEDVDLIMMGTHGRRALSRLLIGSVAEEVVRRAPCPVMTVKLGEANAGKIEVKRILFPTDLSERSNAAIEIASAFAHDFGAELLLLHVNSIPLSFSETTPSAANLMPSMKELEQQLDRVSPPQREVKCARHVLTGDPAATIENFAKQHDVDLIVMTTHGHTGLLRVAFGSIAEAIVRRSPCAVLTIRLDIINEDQADNEESATR
jgi:nucleotide-binding universal stress UspA family protein